MEKAAPEIDYKQQDLSIPNYRMTQLFQQTGGQQVTLTQAGGNTSVFEIPAVVFNLARSKIRFTISYNNAANHRSVYYKDLVPFFDQVRLTTRSGVDLAFINYAQMHSKIITKEQLPLEEFRSRDRIQALCPNAPAPTYAADGKYAYDANTAFPLQDFTYLDGDAIQAAGTDSNIFEISLSDYRESILAVDKDIHLGGQFVYLTLTWSSTNNIGSDVQGDIGAAYGVSAAFAAGTLTVNNLIMYLAQEQNQSIIDSLSMQIRSGGMRYLIPYPIGSQLTLPSATVLTVTARYNRSQGQRIKKVYHACTGGATALAAASHNVWTCESSFNNFYTLWNTVRLQEMNIIVTTTAASPNAITGTRVAGLDWMLLEPYLKGKSIQNSGMYKYNWFWMDSWEVQKSSDHHGVIRSGIPLDAEKRWDIVINYAAAPANAVNNYTFGITERDLLVTSGMVALD